MGYAEAGVVGDLKTASLELCDFKLVAMDVTWAAAWSPDGLCLAGNVVVAPGIALIGLGDDTRGTDGRYSPADRAVDLWTKEERSAHLPTKDGASLAFCAIVAS